MSALAYRASARPPNGAGGMFERYEVSSVTLFTHDPVIMNLEAYRMRKEWTALLGMEEWEIEESCRTSPPVSVEDEQRELDAVRKQNVEWPANAELLRLATVRVV
jgi:hypothetical protein